MAQQISETEIGKRVAKAMRGVKVVLFSQAKDMEEHTIIVRPHPSIIVTAMQHGIQQKVGDATAAKKGTPRASRIKAAEKVAAALEEGAWSIQVDPVLRHAMQQAAQVCRQRGKKDKMHTYQGIRAVVQADYGAFGAWCKQEFGEQGDTAYRKLIAYGQKQAEIEARARAEVSEFAESFEL